MEGALKITFHPCHGQGNQALSPCSSLVLVPAVLPWLGFWLFSFLKAFLWCLSICPSLPPPVCVPTACDHCLRALETAEENAQRLLGKSSLVLPHPEQCSIRKDLHQQCPRCQVRLCAPLGIFESFPFPCQGLCWSGEGAQPAQLDPGAPFPVPSLQVTYCSAECRQAALEQYHQVLCLGPSRDDPAHPLNKLQEAWR